MARGGAEGANPLLEHPVSIRPKFPASLITLMDQQNPTCTFRSDSFRPNDRKVKLSHGKARRPLPRPPSRGPSEEVPEVPGQ